MTPRADDRKFDVAIVVGSDSDLPILAKAAALLTEFGVSHDVQILSAHRTPKQLDEYVESFERRGVKVVIAAAGKAAHLAGRVAASTVLPVIGVPLDDGIGGLDALLSTVQMPGGIPVLTVAIGSAGATNAALAAVAILAIDDSELTHRLARYREKMALDATRKNDELQHLGVEEYVRKKSPHG
jgi:5-(carboxyamino)imidazole ribonucleotide mutase